MDRDVVIGLERLSDCRLLKGCVARLVLLAGLKANGIYWTGSIVH